MPQTINTNVSSLNAQRNLNTSQSSLATSMQRLSSGLRVNSAKDDAAGLAIAERMNAQVRGMNVAIRNANDGISLAQTAEGALATVTDVLQRMRELAIQAQNGSNGSGDRANLDTEFQQLSLEITRIAQQTKFNGTAIVGSGAGAQTFQVGANNGDTMTITTSTVSTVTGDILTSGAASTAVAAIDAQLDLLFAHEFIPKDPQFDWAQKAYHTNEWGAIAARHAFDDLFLSRSATDIAVMLTFAFETGFTNMQFLGLAADAAEAAATARAELERLASDIARATTARSQPSRSAG